MTNSDLLELHLAMATDGSYDLSFYAPNVVVEFPYAPEGHTRKLEGPEAVAAFMQKIPTFASGFELGEPIIHATPDGFIAEYHGSATFKSTGLRYEQDYISVVKVVDDKIARITEYYDPLRVLRAMGEID